MLLCSEIDLAILYSGPPPLGPNLAIVDEESGQLIDIDGSTVGEGKTVRIACSEGLKLTR